MRAMGRILRAFKPELQQMHILEAGGERFHGGRAERSDSRLNSPRQHLFPKDIGVLSSARSRQTADLSEGGVSKTRHVEKGGQWDGVILDSGGENDQRRLQRGEEDILGKKKESRP